MTYTVHMKINEYTGPKITYFTYAVRETTENGAELLRVIRAKGNVEDCIGVAVRCTFSDGSTSGWVATVKHWVRQFGEDDAAAFRWIADNA